MMTAGVRQVFAFDADAAIALEDSVGMTIPNYFWTSQGRVKYGPGEDRPNESF
jgi:hypothetical protein